MPDEPIVVIAGGEDGGEEHEHAERDAMDLGRELEQLHGRDSELFDELSRHRLSGDEHPIPGPEETEAWASLKADLQSLAMRVDSLNRSVSTLLPPPPRPVGATEELGETLSEALEDAIDKADDSLASVPEAPVSVEIPAPNLNPNESRTPRRSLVKRLRKR